MAKPYRLFLDETGVTTLKNINPKYPLFVLSGLIVSKDKCSTIKERADRVKYKYWGNDFNKIVFHSREIGRRENSFKILKNPEIEVEFHKDLVSLLHNLPVRCISIVVDKSDVLKKYSKWNDKTIYKKSAKALFEFFVRFLRDRKGRGDILIESAGGQKDIAFYKQYISYLSAGIPEFDINHKKMKEMVTALSFVSKNNYDIETQVADLLAYAIAVKYLNQKGLKTIVKDSYEDKMCKVLNAKIITLKNRDSSIINLP